MKRFFNAKIRMGYLIIEKELFGEKPDINCFNEGIISIDDENGQIEGIFTFDYIRGNWNEETITFDLFNYDLPHKKSEKISFKVVNYEGNLIEAKKFFFIKADENESQLTLKLGKEVTGEIEKSQMTASLTQARERFA